MDVELARWLVSDAAVAALELAASQTDPDSLAAAERLRRLVTPEQAAAVLTQAGLRRRAASKFGDAAQRLFLTPDGLEQATRGGVSRWRAARLAATGATVVVDVGCGIGADALAFAADGLEVLAVEADPATAVLAAANLGQAGRVLRADATESSGPAASAMAEAFAAGAAVFIDPARRTGAGRTWRIEDLSPSWGFATDLLSGRIGCIKAAPGLPSGFIPPQAATTWVSDHGDLVETSVWSGVGEPGSRTALLLPSGDELGAGPGGDPPVGPIGRYLYEPDPAVIRSRAIAALAERLDARSPDRRIAYLVADQLTATPFARAFEVLEVLPFDERTLRAWVRDHGIGTVEIKVRGLDVDPSVLRRRLKPRGTASVTLVLTPTPDGARALVVRRVVPG